ncbi:conserved hypothetical protein [Sulfurimonas denitrificans DSM 1251]|uniref:NlpC/P60 domain-containing protein n=1 Tax=Sulfurimonas denitrificans (strain ATCC 33889 / DSM 1251) TaxID=326298 RepID=Q30TK7_SULDN|nr:CHAP domain-containing protein [Sulfurimonas denitrificans]ABB43674.1 conserved hypothetical protein [Sulfurimonas denitrificans DSM 1251]MDD3442696.1 CHAP domain-containing protein [Sulfurimonas denitrificans]
MRSVILGLVVVLLLFLTGCSQKEVAIVEPEAQIITLPIIEVKPQEDKELIIRRVIVENALKHLNKSSGQDCSGFVDLVNSDTNESFYKAEMLYKYYDNSRRSRAIFNMMQDEDKLVSEPLPKVGDIVFFSDTLQKTKRRVGSLNITHMGIVTAVDEDETVHFIHNIQGKNKIDQLNRKYSDHHMLSDKHVNSFLKRCSKNRQKSKCLTSFFFSSYASPVPKEKIELSKN